jgi:hypothetical protein
VYTIVYAVLEEGSSYIAAVAVKDKETLVSPTPRFLLYAQYTKKKPKDSPEPEETINNN